MKFYHFGEIKDKKRKIETNQISENEKKPNMKKDEINPIEKEGKTPMMKMDENILMMKMGEMNPIMGMNLNNPMMKTDEMNPIFGINLMNPQMLMGLSMINDLNIPKINENINVEKEDGTLWNLCFENFNNFRNQTVMIIISSEKLIREAINMYKEKTGITEECLFILNSKQLLPDIKISQSGLCNLSKILVISFRNVCGAI